jgi:hypothetical protein
MISQSANKRQKRCNLHFFVFFFFLLLLRFSHAGLSSEVSTKLVFVHERVVKLRSSPVVAGSAQLKPHVEFLVTRVSQCKDKLAALNAAQAGKPRTGAIAPPEVLLQSEEEVVVDLLSPAAARPLATEVAGPPKLPQRPENNRGRSQIIERTSPADEEDVKKKAGSQIVSGVPPVRIGEMVSRKEVSAMDVLGGSPPKRSPRDLRGVEQMGTTPLLKISSFSRGTNTNNNNSNSSETSTPPRRTSKPEPIDPGLGSPSPAVVVAPLQLPDQRKSAVLDFDKIVGRVRGDSLVSEEGSGDSDKMNWKVEYDKMVQKFESAKGLIVKMQEKTRRMELQAAQVPPLLKKTSQLEGKVTALEMVRTHYEEKVPQLNTRIVELENELLVLKNSVGNSALDQSVATGERVWVCYNHLWHEGEVLEKTVDGAFLIKLDAVLEAKVGFLVSLFFFKTNFRKVFGAERVRKITVEGLESTPVVFVGDLDDSSQEPDTSAANATPIAQALIEPRAIATTSSTAAATTTGSTPVARPLTTMDTLLSSTKQNVKNLFAPARARKQADTPTSLPSSSGSIATTQQTPIKAQEKLRSLFSKDRSSGLIAKVGFFKIAVC